MNLNNYDYHETRLCTYNYQQWAYKMFDVSFFYLFITSRLIVSVSWFVLILDSSTQVKKQEEEKSIYLATFACFLNAGTSKKCFEILEIVLVSCNFASLAILQVLPR